MPRTMIRFWTLFLALLTLAGLLGAAVGGMTVRAAPQRQAPLMTAIINEVAWMGTQTDANGEWIELYNPNVTAVNLAGWNLVTSDNAINFTFPATTTVTCPNLSIPAGGYYLLELTADTTISDIPADCIYTGALNDNGVTISLYDSTGTTLIDTANNGGAAWPAGSNTAANNRRSMERNGIILDGPTAWHSNDGLTINGHDAANNPILGTPKQANSPTPPPPTPTFTATNTFTPTNTSTATATFTPIAPPHLVISEFRSTGPGGAGDEFVELFNATGAATNIGGWTVKKSTGCGTSISTLFTIPANTVLAPGQHYLAATRAILTNIAGTTIATADQAYSSGLVDDGGIALIDVAGNIVDMVGMCISTTYREGVSLMPLSGITNQSYERKPGGAMGGCYDLNNNSTDFTLLASASPMNRASPISMCSGVILASPTTTPTATRTATPTRTTTPTRVPTALPGIILINEILPHPRSDWNNDGIINYGDEYIELINAGTESYTLKGWVLANDRVRSAYTIPTITLVPQQILILFHSQTGIELSDGGDEVILYRTTGAINDAFTYPVIEATDRTWCRLPDGRGTWSFGCWPSPGKPNSRTGAGMPTPAAEPVCPLADVVPPAIQLAECGSPGDSIWRSDFWNEGEFWLKSRDKDVIVK